VYNNVWRRDKETWDWGRLKCISPKRRGVISSPNFVEKYTLRI